MLACLDLNILKGDRHKSLIVRTSTSVIRTYCTTRQFVLSAWRAVGADFVGSTSHGLHVAYQFE